MGLREKTACGVTGLEFGGTSYPFSLPPRSQPPPAFPAVSIPIWSQVNLWHNPTWKCMEMLPITMKPRERLSRWRPPWSAVCRLPAFQKPQGARSQPFGPDWWSGAVCIKLFTSLTWPRRFSVGTSVSFALKLDKPEKCHSQSLSKADS